MRAKDQHCSARSVTGSHRGSPLTTSRRVVTKMPSVEQADRFFELFPNCPLIVLVRDGRNVSESGVKSFGWSYERAFDRWRRAADVVLELQRRHCRQPAFRGRAVRGRRRHPARDDAPALRRRRARPGALPVRARSRPCRYAGRSTLRSEPVPTCTGPPSSGPSDFDPHARFESWTQPPSPSLRSGRRRPAAGARLRALRHDGRRVDHRAARYRLEQLVQAASHASTCPASRVVPGGQFCESKGASE